MAGFTYIIVIELNGSRIFFEEGNIKAVCVQTDIGWRLMIDGRDEPARFHGGEDAFEFLSHGLFAEVHDTFVIAAEEHGIWIAFTEGVDINARHALQWQYAFDACFTEPCKAVTNITV